MLPMVPAAVLGRAPWTFVLPGSILAFPLRQFGAVPFVVGAILATVLEVAIVHAATDSRGPALLVIAAGMLGVSWITSMLLAS